MLEAKAASLGVEARLTARPISEALPEAVARA
jgi:hypothetical protein